MKKKGFVDLHLHSIYSDGENDLNQLLNLIRKQKVTTFSITDHDNIDSVSKIKSCDLTNLEYINGVELSVKFKDFKFHLLGYDFNEDSIELKKICDYVYSKRKERFLEILNNISKKFYYFFSYSDIDRFIEENNHLGRIQLVKFLKQQGLRFTWSEIINTYIEPCETNISYDIDIEQAISILKRSNALCVLAHPFEYTLRYGIYPIAYIEELINMGLDGIEVYNSKNTRPAIKDYKRIAKRYNLLISGGSDYHGSDKTPDVNIGSLSENNIHISKLSIIDEIRRRNNI